MFALPEFGPLERISLRAAIGLVVVGAGGLAVTALDPVPNDWRIDLLIIFAFPAGIATAVYVTRYPTVRWPEIGVLFGWGLLAALVAGFIGFFATMDASTVFSGRTGEVLWKVALFLAAIGGLSIPYAIAGYYRAARPFVAGLIVLLSAIVVVLSMGLTATALTT